MILCIDIGNTSIYGGVFDGDDLVFEFRKSNQDRPSPDEFGVFLVQLLAVRGMTPETISHVGIASVVPDCLPNVSQAVERYLGITPLVLKAGVKTGLNVRTRNPNEVGADRIANAIAAVDLFPDKNLLIIDLGTATTFCVVTANRDYLGGVIAAGLTLSMRALGRNTAQLPLVDIVARDSIVGRTTIESIQNGLFYGHVGLVREVTARVKREIFDGERPTVIGTGGYAPLFENEGLFDTLVPALVLRGVLKAIYLNDQGR